MRPAGSRRSALLACVGATLALSIGACATPVSGPSTGLAYRAVGVGSTLVLHAPLEIPGRHAHVRIQATGAGEMDPYCDFEVSTLSESPRTVVPDVFTIWRVGRSVSPSSDWGMHQSLQLAAIGVGVGVGVGVGGGGGWPGAGSVPTQLFYKTRFWLRSGKQPDVRKLTCQWDQMTASGAAFARHLTEAEIRAALGDRFTLNPAGAPPPVP